MQRMRRQRSTAFLTSQQSSPAPNDNEDAEGEKTEAAVEANNDNGPIASTGTVSSRKPASTAGKAPALHSDDGEVCGAPLMRLLSADDGSPVTMRTT